MLRKRLKSRKQNQTKFDHNRLNGVCVEGGGVNKLFTVLNGNTALVDITKIKQNKKFKSVAKTFKVKSKKC